MKGPTSPHIAGLNIIRLTAAILVVLDHYTSSIGRNEWLANAIGGGLPSFPFLSHFTDAGGVGVDIFFVISGLVIAGSANGNSPRRFAKGRFFRLMPSVWIASTFSAIVLMFATHWEWREIFATYLRSLVLSPKGPWVDGSFWTLCVEISFYALIFAVLCKNKMGDFDKIFGVLGIWVSAIAFASLLLLPGNPFLYTLINSWPAKLLLLLNGAEFVFGAFLYLILFVGPSLLRFTVLAICGLGVCAKLISGLAFFHGGAAGGFTEWLPLIIWLAAVLAMVGSVLFDEPISRAFGSAMPVVRQMGLLTYPLYLIHSPLGLVVLQHVFQTTHSPILALAAAIGVVLLAATLILLVEPILRSWSKWPIQRAVNLAQGRFFPAWLAEPTSRLK